MKARNRADQILRELRQEGSLSLDVLIERLGASAASGRRDLVKLEAKGLVRRTHGGVILVRTASLTEPFRYDSLFQKREGSTAPLKNAESGSLLPNSYRKMRRLASRPAQRRLTSRVISGTGTIFGSSPMPSILQWS